MKVILYIDTSDSQATEVALEIDGVRYTERMPSGALKSQAVLPLIAKLLSGHETTLRDIREIRVNVGPGSYTGLRVGAAVANMLGLLLEVPVNSKRALVTPTYT